jgi:general secretion pathway protein D
MIHRLLLHRPPSRVAGITLTALIAFAISLLLLVGYAQVPGTPLPPEEEPPAEEFPEPEDEFVEIPEEVLPDPDAETPAPPVTPERMEELQRLLRDAITNRAGISSPGRVVLPASPAPATQSPAPAQTPAPAPAPAQTQPTPRPFPSFPAFPTPRASTAPPPTTASTPTPERAESGFFFNLKGATLEEVFDAYGELTDRTVLHQSNLQGSVTLSTRSNLSREEAIQALQGALAINGITLIPQGDKFVKAVPMANSVQEGGTILSKDAEAIPDTDEYVTQVVQLKIAPPSDVAQLLQAFAKTPQGIVPIDSSMILVIRDYAANVKRMLEIIDRVDVEPESEYNLEIIPIRYGKVTDLFDTMSALVMGGAGGGVARAPTAVGAARAGVTGTGAASTLGTSSRFGTSRTSSSRMSGYGGSALQTRGIQSMAGQPTALGTAPATAATAAGGTSFQQRLSTILNRAAGDDPMQQVLGDARIVPDERSNSLIVYATKQDMKMITNIVNKVDVLLAQVLIEGIVVAVAIGDQQELGVSWAQSPKRFGGDFSGTGAINSGFFGVLTNFPSSSPSGFSYWGRLGDDITVAVRALASDSKVRILQRPRIQTSHAVPGVFFSGSTVPFISGYYDYGGIGTIGSRSQVDYMDVGIELNVTPFITPDGLVVMDISQGISQLGEYVKIDNNDVPTTTTRSAAATLSVRDGETIMLGGYIEENRTSGKSGVPVLKDIPGLGALFRASSKRNSRSELILLMKVTVLKNPTEASALAETERSLLPGLSDAQREFDKSDRQRR